jgi:DHA1 family tetracycline resistance protein-like MFS transporter
MLPSRNKVKVDGQRLVSAQPKALNSLLAVNFADSLGYAVVMPFLVYLVLQWGGNAVVYSLISVAYSAFQLIGSPLLGRWSDIWGRKRILLLSEAGSVLSWVIALVAFYVPVVTLAHMDSSLLGKFTLTLPLLLLFLARALDGLTGGNVSVANAYVGDISAADQRNANFGKLSASANAGQVLGPALAGFLVGTALGYQLPVMLAATVCFIATMMIWFGLPGSNSVAAPTHPTAASAMTACTGRNHLTRADRPASASLSVADILRLPRIPVLLSASFLVNLAFSIFYIALPVYVVKALSWSPGKMGAFFAVLGLVMVVVEGPVLKGVSKVCSNAVLIAMGGLMLGCGFLLLDTQADTTVFAAAVLIAAGNGLIWPLLVAQLSARGGEHQGAVQGLAGSVAAIASIIGLLMGGLLYASFEGELFIVSSILAFIVMFMALWARRSDGTRES